MNEQKPCLRDFVEAVDDGKINPCEPGLRGQFAIEEVGSGGNGPEQYDFVVCAIRGCNVNGSMRTAPGEPGVGAISYEDEDNDTECLSVQNPTEYLLQSPDESGCLAAAMAFAMKKRFGSTYTPSNVDTWMGRRPKELPTSENEIELNMALLQHGYAVEIVQPADAIRVQEYYQAGTTKTYQDYVRVAKQTYTELPMDEIFATTYTEDIFVQDMAFRRANEARFSKYSASGQLSFAYEDLTVESVNRRLKTAALIATMMFVDYESGGNTFHAVSVERVRRVPGGDCLVDYFNPDAHYSSMNKRRGERLSEVIRLDNVVHFIKPFVPAQV